jgi:hypothetical protein
MANYIDIQRAIDRGRGAAAQVLGEPSNVFRLVAGANGNYLDSTNKIASPNIFFRGCSAKDIRAGLESDSRLGTFWFEMIGDMSSFQLGDIFLINDPVYGSGSTLVPWTTTEFRAICFAQHAPVKKSFGARLNTTIQVRRLTNAAAQNGGKYWQAGQNDGSPVCLVNGQFVLVAGTPSNIPCGLIATGRTYGEKSFNDDPTNLHKSAWYCYVPPLQGFNFREDDRVIAADGAIYRVLIPYQQQAGAVGSQLYLERLSAGE